MNSKTQKALCSIIIRTKNEERWISSCLKNIESQTYKNYEIIIVDNESNDSTLKRAKKFKIKNTVSISDYLPGKALNEGIKYASGEYIVCISAHCIPINNKWLENLVISIESDESIVGAYGRQEPMSFSSASDKRDLLLVFGLDPKIQIKDSFFHNANSIIRKDILDKFPFDNKTTNIEDRLWGQQMIKEGYRLAYTPDASVYHYHGIHQDGNDERLRNVVRIIENTSGLSQPGKINPDDLNIIAIIPMKGKDIIYKNKSLMSFTIEAAKKSKFIDNIIFSTDTKENMAKAESFGAECPFIRPRELSQDWVSLEKVQQFSLEQLEKMDISPDLLVHLEVTFPFRQDSLIDNMIEFTVNHGYDSVIACRRESGYLWQEKKNNSFDRIDSGDIPRIMKEKSYVGLHGLACITHPEFVRNGSLMGKNIGLYKVNNPLSHLEIRDQATIQLVETLLID
tara:strand:- start:491 stop:1852 length:1362 start_codon:yes stop_codon:yes gene_type:complete